jgi:hypothetical protein
VATLTANAGGQTTQTDLEFVAPLTALTTISVQADPAVIGVNTAAAPASRPRCAPSCATARRRTTWSRTPPWRSPS